MTTRSYWYDGVTLPAFPKLDGDLKVDVAVVGGGITGVTAAYLLKKAGKRVALLERDRCGGGDTGNTTAHLTANTDLRPTELAKKFGNDHAKAVWDAGHAAVEQVHANSHAEGIDCDFAWVPGFLHVARGADAAKEAEGLREDAALAAGWGFDTTFVDAVPLAGTPGVRVPHQARFHPLKYLAGLLKTIPGGGSHVFEGTDVSEATADPLTLTTAGGHRVTCDRLVIATHVPVMGLKGVVGAALFQTKIAPYTSYVVGARVPPGAVPDGLFWDTNDPYFYLRLNRRPGFDEVIFGGRDHKTGQEHDTEKRFRELEAKLAELVPGANDNYRWSGQVVETHDGLPYIGETADKQFTATGFSGNGTTFGTLAAMMATDWVAGRKNPWSELFAPGRKPVHGVWDYLTENIDYPYYMLRDRLRRAEGTSAADLQPGEGKILKLGGERVAAFKDKAGAVTTLSPVCTHMGCRVRWNPAETTWDCPCHGSRFRPTGEVLAGPAEAPLAKVEVKG